MSRRRQPEAKRLAVTQIPWRTLLLWAAPLLVFGWLTVAGRAAGDARTILPKPGDLYGGGAIGERFVPRANYALHFTTVSVTADGNAVKFYGDWNGRCAGFDGPVTAAFFKQVTVDERGSFDGSGELESSAAEGRFEFRGRFTGAGSAVGTGRVRFTFRPEPNGSAYACDTGAVSWQVRTSVRRFGRPQPRPGRVYFGNTSQRLPILLRVSRDGRFVSQQAGLWNAACKLNKTGLGRGTASPPVRIRKGRFSFTENYTERYGEFVAHISSRHVGAFGATTVAGTWRVRVAVRRVSDKKRTDSCDSGRVSWSARL
jgi:hypothetical protein